MPKVKDHSDPRVKATLKIMEANPNLMLPAAMRAAKFTIEESRTEKYQKWIRRRMQSPKQQQQPPTKITISTPAASAVSSLSTTPTPEHKAKAIRVRHTSSATQQIRQNKLVEKNKRKAAHKKASLMYKRESEKPEGTVGKLSALSVEKIVEKETKVRIAARSILDTVKKGRAGLSPLKQGRPGIFPDETFDNLTNAFESFIKINQINGTSGQTSASSLTKLLKQCTSPSMSCDCTALKNRLLNHTAEDLNCGNNKNAEERRVRWTTYNNIKTWFENWERDLVELGFAHLDADKKVIIPPDQLARIVNIDETALVMDASTSTKGGRPEAIFYSPRLPNLGNQTIKNSASTTMITGSTAAGEPIPPHFQFATAAQSEETMRFRVEMLTYFSAVKGKWGHESNTSFLPTIGMNEKGGMNDPEFEKYFLENIVRLYPDAADVPGKRVMLKVDSGPGRLFLSLLVKARTLGFYLYPGVPNTTAVTQETDQNYGPFKTQFQQNLSDLSDARIHGRHVTSLPPWIVGLIVFGGVDPESEHIIQKCAFNAGFCREQNLNAWNKCGAAPVTRTPLHGHKQVRRELHDDDDDDENTKMLLGLQATNNMSTFFLTQQGYDGNAFVATVKKRPKQSNVTERHTQDRIDMLARAKTHGDLFYATGGEACNSEDALLAIEKNTREADIKELTKKKELFLKLSAIEEKAKTILVRASAVEKYTGLQLKPLLKWYGLKGVDAMAVPKCKEEWKKILLSLKGPPPIEEWTEDEEKRLEELVSKPITLKDTALGRHQNLIKRQISSLVPTMTKAERKKFKEQLDSMDDDGDGDSPMESSVSVMPNLEIEKDTAAPTAELQQLSSMSDNGTNGEGSTEAV